MIYPRSPIMKHGMNIMPHEWQKLKDAEAILFNGLSDLKKGHFEAFSIDCYMFEDAMQYYYANYADRSQPKEMYEIDAWLSALHKRGINWELEGGRNDEGKVIFRLQ